MRYARMSRQRTRLDAERTRALRRQGGRGPITDRYVIEGIRFLIA